MATMTGTAHPDTLFGTSGNDQLLGLGGDDILTGSDGDDTLNGGSGQDIADYSHLGQSITLTPGGGVTKGSGKHDTLIGIETIVGDASKVNTIDASTAGAGVGMDVDLAANKVDVRNIPGIGNLHFNVQNFNDIVGTNTGSRLAGNINNNRITGGSGDDLIVGTKGNDTLNGGDGNNTLDYGNLGHAVTILPRGSIDKGNFGTDKVSNFSKIIGANGQANSINANTPEGAGGSLNVNLANHSLGVNLPNGVTQQFEVHNFVNVTGSTGNDTIVGDSQNNTIAGSKGNDTLDGGTGNDTLDYSNLGHAVTILPRGVIDKGDFGKDTVNHFTKIIGATGQANTIDASTADSGSSLNVNLANKSLGVNIPNVGSQQFEVHNFVNVIGSKNNDKIVGGNVNSKLTGGAGNDTIHGGSKNDVITGSNSASRGVGEIDTLSGGGGKDKFIIGDRKGAYYLGKGSGDYAKITDFDLFNDSIDIGSLKNYSFGFGGKNTIDLFAGKDCNTRDLIAKIQITDSCLASVIKGFSSKSASLLGGLNYNIDPIISKMEIAHG